MPTGTTFALPGSRSSTIRTKWPGSSPRRSRWTTSLSPVALLHDVAEDTEYQINDIREEFGDTVADIVDGATKISDIFKSHDVTQAESYRKMLLSMVNDIRVMLVKFADRLHNMRTLEYLPPDKQKRLAKETLDIYAPFAHRFGLANIKWELEDLSFKYLYREAYDAIAHDLKSRRREREHYIRQVRRSRSKSG